MFGLDKPQFCQSSNDDSIKTAELNGFLHKLSPKIHLTALMKCSCSCSDKDEPPQLTNNDPIAEVFPNTTIIFADIAGFTAWSLEREPSQVFRLLETLYAGFDAIAKRLGVFKVETIGDCYVAVTSLPDPNKEHAVAMARFAAECLDFTNSITNELKVQFGPGTGDLKLRVSMHSGPVTAGVLRGDKSRFHDYSIKKGKPWGAIQDSS